MYITFTLHDKGPRGSMSSSRAALPWEATVGRGPTPPLSPAFQHENEQAAPAHVSLKLFSVFLCRFDTAMRAASCTRWWKRCRAAGMRPRRGRHHPGQAGAAPCPSSGHVEWQSRQHADCFHSSSALSLASHQSIVRVCSCHGGCCFCCKLIQLRGGDALIHAGSDFLGDQHLRAGDDGPFSAMEC